MAKKSNKRKKKASKKTSKKKTSKKKTKKRKTSKKKTSKKKPELELAPVIELEIIDTDDESLELETQNQGEDDMRRRTYMGEDTVDPEFGPHFDEESEVDHDDPDSEFEVPHESADKVARHAAFDIFQDKCDPMVKKGIPIAYTLKRDGQRLTSRIHPWSWDEIHDEYGGGNYQIFARRTDQNEFVKCQSQTMAGARKNPLENTGNSQDENQGSQDSSNKAPSFVEMMAIMKESNREASDKSETQSKSSMEMMMGFMSIIAQTMAGKKDDSGSTQMFEMFKMQQRSIEKIAEAMNQNMEKLYERVNNKPDELGPMALIEMLTNREESGYKKALTLQKALDDSMDKKIKDQAKLIAAAEGGGGDGEEKSMTEKLISSLAPTIVQAMSKQYPANANQDQNPVQKKLPVSASGSARTQGSHGPQGPQRRSKVAQRPGSLDGPKPRSVPPLRPVKVDKKDLVHPDYRPTLDPEAGPASVIETAPVSIPASIPTSKESTTVSEVETEQKVVETAPEDVHTTIIQGDMVMIEETDEDQGNGILKKITDAAAPLIGVSLVQGEKPQVAAKNHLVKLQALGISQNELLENFTEQGIIELARKMNVPEIADPWLKDYYAHIIKTQPGTNDAGVSTQS